MKGKKIMLLRMKLIGNIFAFEKQNKSINSFPPRHASTSSLQLVQPLVVCGKELILILIRCFFDFAIVETWWLFSNKILGSRKLSSLKMYHITFEWSMIVIGNCNNRFFYKESDAKETQLTIFCVKINFWLLCLDVANLNHLK